MAPIDIGKLIEQSHNTRLADNPYFGIGVGLQKSQMPDIRQARNPRRNALYQVAQSLLGGGLEGYGQYKEQQTTDQIQNEIRQASGNLKQLEQLAGNQASPASGIAGQIYQTVEEERRKQAATPPKTRQIQTGETPDGRPIFTPQVWDPSIRDYRLDPHGYVGPKTAPSKGIHVDARTINPSTENSKLLEARAKARTTAKAAARVLTTIDKFPNRGEGESVLSALGRNWVDARLDPESPAAQLRRNVYGALGIKLKAISGATVTEDEFKRFKEQLGGRSFDTLGALRHAMELEIEDAIAYPNSLQVDINTATEASGGKPKWKPFTREEFYKAPNGISPEGSGGNSSPPPGFVLD